MSRRRPPPRASEPLVLVTCQMCGASFQMGPHAYKGKFIPAYRLDVCQACFEGNWDGWNPRLEPLLEAHLKAQDLPLPARNALGLYPRGL